MNIESLNTDAAVRVVTHASLIVVCLSYLSIFKHTRANMIVPTCTHVSSVMVDAIGDEMITHGISAAIDHFIFPSVCDRAKASIIVIV
ncbi:hypothetical protein SO02S_31290 [Salmonella enterica subsp. enterica serovar Oranienburg]|nr:hypothetical protein SO02S_31290 [Salmonella enterica subsp. enterica serovar Oranienburg]